MGYFDIVLAALPSEGFFVRVDVRNDKGAGFTIDLEKGEPVFTMTGSNKSHGAFLSKWIAEHPVPLRLPTSRATYLNLARTSSDRIRVRLSRLNALPARLADKIASIIAK